MYQTRYMRLLRLKFNISLADLARVSKVSPQRISQIELQSEHPTEYQRQLIYEAFSIIALENCNTALRRDLRRLEYCLLDFTDKEELS